MKKNKFADSYFGDLKMVVENRQINPLQTLMSLQYIVMYICIRVQHFQNFKKIVPAARKERTWAIRMGHTG